MIVKRISDISCDVDAFNRSLPVYEEALQQSGHKIEPLPFERAAGRKKLGGGGGFTRPIPGDGGADQLRGVPIIGRLPTYGTRGPEDKGCGQIWPDAEGLVQGTRCERSCGSEPQLLHEGVSARPTLWR